MTPAMHTTVASSVTACETCHEASAADLGFQGILGQIYLRPDTANSGLSKGAGLDTAHGTGAAATADCNSSGCHSSTTGPFVGGMPSNHIPINTGAACVDCHANGYSPGITTMKHTDVTTATPLCATCHNTSTVYAGTGQGTLGRPWQMNGAVGTAGGASTTHFPLGSTDCAASGCHSASDTLTTNGASFFLSSTNPVLSAAGHASVTTQTCQSCHALSMSWKGVATLVTPTSAHIPPDNTTTPTVNCSSCHTGNGFVSAGFHLTGTPGGAGAVMSPSMHTAVSSLACTTCHEANAGDLTFQGILLQIYLRPNFGANSGLSQATDTTHAAGTSNSADCGSSGCHSTTGPFQGMPSGHIAIAAGAICATCHTTTTTSVVLPMPHTGMVTGTCASCHNTATLFAGSVFTPNASGGGGSFGTQTGNNFRPKQIISSPAIGSAGGHIPLPTGDDCNVCHTSTAYSAFGPGTAMVHTGITSGCATCHAAGSSWYGESYTASPLVTTGNVTLSPLHVPISTSANPACEECHSTTTFTSFGTTTKVNHTSGAFMTYTSRGSSTPKCVTCHAPSKTTWYKVTLSTETMGSHQGSSTSSDCIQCHSTSNFGGAAAAAVSTSRRPSMRFSAGPELRPGAGAPAGTGTGGGVTTQPFTHVGVLPGGCASCHGAGGSATPVPANHLPSNLSCDACHRTSAWLPALFLHNGVAAGSCGSCHTGSWATPKPANHMITARTCDTCHASTSSWSPQTYAHLDTVYTPHPSSVVCTACHLNNTEQVVWKYPNLKPGCAGCHGPQFGGGSQVRRTQRRGPAEVPRGP
jgi:predicted CXXCH cytochrome family protein